jgi:hypothetical protein
VESLEREASGKKKREKAVLKRSDTGKPSREAFFEVSIGLPRDR